MLLYLTTLPYGRLSTVAATVAVEPEAASAWRVVATPGSDAGEKLTVPSRAEVAAEDCIDSSAPAVQIVCAEQALVLA